MIVYRFSPKLTFVFGIVWRIMMDIFIITQRIEIVIYYKNYESVKSTNRRLRYLLIDLKYYAT